jgi:anti-sigma factor RsiW
VTVLNRDQIELIHREIDGANAPEESVAYQSLIEDDSEARALDADIRHVAQLFDRAGHREPPLHLKQAILDALPRKTPATPVWAGNPLTAIVDGFRKRPGFALASSLCVGLVAGFGLYAAVAGTTAIDRSDTSGLAGTLAEPRSAGAVGPVNEIPIDVDGVSGRVSVKAGETDVVLELESDVERAVEVRLTFDVGAYGLRGFSQQRNEATPSFTAEPGLIHVSTSGANTQTFVLNHEGPVSPLTLSLFDNGEELFAATLLTRGSNQGG